MGGAQRDARKNRSAYRFLSVCVRAQHLVNVECSVALGLANYGQCESKIAILMPVATTAFHLRSAGLKNPRQCVA